MNHWTILLFSIADAHSPWAYKLPGPIRFYKSCLCLILCLPIHITFPSFFVLQSHWHCFYPSGLCTCYTCPLPQILHQPHGGFIFIVIQIHRIFPQISTQLTQFKCHFPGMSSKSFNKNISSCQWDFLELAECIYSPPQLPGFHYWTT